MKDDELKEVFDILEARGWEPQLCDNKGIVVPQKEKKERKLLLSEEKTPRTAIHL